MSKVKIQGHASGSGTVTLGAPNTDSDRTITLPDTTGTLLDENSSVPAANLTGTVASARITAGSIANDLIDSQHYAAASIDNEHLADDAVDSDEIAAGAIDDAHFASGTIVGKQTIWVPSNAMTPTVSNGCADITAVETTASRPDMYVLDFDASSDEHAQFTVAFPKSWNLGTVTFRVFWTTTATDTDGVAWALEGAVSNNSTLDVPYGTPIVVTDDNSTGTAELCNVSGESAAMTIAGTKYDNDLSSFRIYRDVSDANDDMAEDARLLGIQVFYTTDALNDA